MTNAINESCQPHWIQVTNTFKWFGYHNFIPSKKCYEHYLDLYDKSIYFFIPNLYYKGIAAILLSTLPYFFQAILIMNSSITNESMNLY